MQTAPIHPPADSAALDPLESSIPTISSSTSSKEPPKSTDESEPADAPQTEKLGAAGGESSEPAEKPTKKRGRPALSPEEKARRKAERAAARKAKRESEKAAKLRATAIPPSPGVFAQAPDAAGGVPPEVSAEIHAQAAAMGVDLSELVKPEVLAPIIVGGIDGSVCALGSVRYGKAGAKHLSLDANGQKMCEAATAAYIQSVQIQMTPGQALLLAFALAYGPRVVEVEMAHQAKRGAKTPEAKNG